MKKVAVALDIDGVLLRGKDVLKGARTAISKLNDHEIPYVFLTNGGGVKESEKALILSEKLDTLVVSEVHENINNKITKRYLIACSLLKRSCNLVRYFPKSYSPSLFSNIYRTFKGHIF